MHTILVSSLNENMKLAKLLQEQLTSIHIESNIINLVELGLPLYDSNKEERDGIPTQIESLMNEMSESPGYLVIAPEYNGSIPPVLSNAIAWISRTGDDFRRLFNEKVILLATHSGSGGTGVTQAMRAQFMKLGAIILSREIITTYGIGLKKESSLRILQQFVKFSQK